MKTEILITVSDDIQWIKVITSHLAGTRNDCIKCHISYLLSYFNKFILKIDQMLNAVPVSDCLCSSICSVQPQPDAASIKNRQGTYSAFSRMDSRFQATSETCCAAHLVGSQALIRVAGGYVAAGEQPNTTQKIISCFKLSHPL